jgi:hypothetical protein
MRTPKFAQPASQPGLRPEFVAAAAAWPSGRLLLSARMRLIRHYGRNPADIRMATHVSLDTPEERTAWISLAARHPDGAVHLVHVFGFDPRAHGWQHDTAPEEYTDDGPTGRRVAFVSASDPFDVIRVTETNRYGRQVATYLHRAAVVRAIPGARRNERETQHR